jgi:predicted phage terminase large subunit-like protein
VSSRFDGLPLLDLIPALSPDLRSPYHLREWCELIERAAAEPIRALCSCPIRHFKTTTSLHGIIWLLLKDPTRRIILLSHSHQRAQTLGKQLRQLAKETSIGPARGWDTIDEWRNDVGGGVVIMSADQSKLGYDCGALFFDDPIDEMGWDDPRQRDAIDKTISHYTARCMNKGVPGPVLGVASRGHPDDPIGRRLSRSAVQWTYVHYPAILDEGTDRERAFAPDVWSLEALKAMRAELKESDPAERIWHAQLMGDPQPEGSDLFGPPTLYTGLPTWGYRIAHGVDFAYTDAPGSDFFAAVTGRIYGRKLYLLEVQRHKLDAVLLESTCKAILGKYGRAPMWSYQAGPEVGLSRLLIQRGVPVGIMPARYNKLVRAQKTIRRWNEGDILVPTADLHPWQPGFLHRVSLFRGHERDRDDEVDAMVSCADAMLGGATTAGGLGVKGAHKPYQGMLG